MNGNDPMVADDKQTIDERMILKNKLKGQRIFRLFAGNMTELDLKDDIRSDRIEIEINTKIITRDSVTKE